MARPDRASGWNSSEFSLKVTSCCTVTSCGQAIDLDLVIGFFCFDSDGKIVEHCMCCRSTNRTSVISARCSSSGTLRFWPRPAIRVELRGGSLISHRSSGRAQRYIRRTAQSAKNMPTLSIFAELAIRLCWWSRVTIRYRVGHLYVESPPLFPPFRSDFESETARSRCVLCGRKLAIPGCPRRRSTPRQAPPSWRGGSLIQLGLIRRSIRSRYCFVHAVRRRGCGRREQRSRTTRRRRRETLRRSHEMSDREVVAVVVDGGASQRRSSLLLLFPLSS